MGALLSVIAGYIVGVVIAVLVEVGGTLVSEDFFWSDYWRQSWIRLLIPLFSAATGLLIFLAMRDRDRGRFTGPAMALGLVVVLGSFGVGG